LEKYIEIQETNRDIIKKAMRSDFNDFEDAIQYFSAERAGQIDFVITRNLRDFKKSDISVLSPDTAIKILLNEFGK